MSVRIVQGDCRDVLRAMDENSVQCVVTSPPYWGLRDYGLGKGALGLEPSPAIYIENMVALFREVRRVLRKDGVMWLNVGDSYAGGGRGGNPTRESSTLEGSNATQEQSIIKRGSQLPAGLHAKAQAAGALSRAWQAAPPGFKAKQRLMLPARLAIALQDDGWWLRDEIVWHKPNPMPSSVKDRTTPAHEMVYMFSKRPRYFFDAEAIAEPCEWDPADTKMPDGWDTGAGAHGSVHRNGREKGARRNLAQFDIEDIDSQNGTRQIDGDARNGPEPYVGDPPNSRRNSFARVTKSSAGEHGQKPQHRPDREPISYGRSGNKARVEASDRGAIRGNVAGSVPWEGTTRNKRSVWTIPTEPFGDAHFATFPTRLVEPMILAATSAKGACARCGAPWARVTDVRYVKSRAHGDPATSRSVVGRHEKTGQNNFDGSQMPRMAKETATTGWEPTCKCTDAGVRPCIVMDPFLGSGTVGLVADRLGRDAIGIELNPSYAAMAERRIRGDSSLFARVEVVAEAVPEAPQAVELSHEDVARHGKSTKMASAAPDATAASSQNETRSDATE